MKKESIKAVYSKTEIAPHPIFLFQNLCSLTFMPYIIKLIPRNEDKHFYYAYVTLYFGLEG